jgi:hypothetical protein
MFQFLLKDAEIVGGHLDEARKCGFDGSALRVMTERRWRCSGANRQQILRLRSHLELGEKKYQHLQICNGDASKIRQQQLNTVERMTSFFDQRSCPR